MKCQWHYTPKLIIFFLVQSFDYIFYIDHAINNFVAADIQMCQLNYMYIQMCQLNYMYIQMCQLNYMYSSLYTVYHLCFITDTGTKRFFLLTHTHINNNYIYNYVTNTYM